MALKSKKKYSKASKMVTKMTIAMPPLIAVFFKKE
jgi:hypothetical protein